MDKENTATKKTQEEITESVLKKMWGEKACTRKVNIEGENKPIEFNIYDGYAKSTNKKGKVYEMEFPMIKAIKQCKDLEDEIIKYIGNGLDPKEISPLHSMITFSTLYIDGVEIDSED